MTREIITGILILSLGVIGFITRHKEVNNPWMNFGVYGAIVALGIYQILEVPLGLPQNIAPWVFLGVFLLCLVMGFFWFCKDKERKEQAAKEKEEQLKERYAS